MSGGFVGKNDDGSYSLSIGPVHPALKEPVRLNLRIDGERICGVDFELSQVHRGIEWMGTRRNPVQVLFLAERICGICNMCHTLAFSKAVEAIGGIQVPPRAEYIRTIAAELERIHSHILWAGVAAHELGFDSVMHYTWRLRENVMDTIESLTGNRVTKAMITIGGVRRDVDEKSAARILRTAEFYRKAYGKMADVFLSDPVMKPRTRDTGVLTKQDALRTCAVGPTARASGVMKDVRRDEAYGAYQDFGFEPVSPAEVTGEVRGDVYDRIIVRLLEVKQSADIVEWCVKNLPQGKIAHEEKTPKLLAELRGFRGEALGRLEAPRGEVIHYVRMAGESFPCSWKVRAPTYNNMLAWVPMLMGAQVADIPIIAASIDPCMSCANRAVRAGGGVLSQEALHGMSVEKTRQVRRRLGVS